MNYFTKDSVLWYVDDDTTDVDFEITDCGAYIRLDYIFIPVKKRRKGLATKIITELIECADEEGKILVLQTWNKWGISKKYLKDFYSKFGFVERKENKKRKSKWFKNDDMYRIPKSNKEMIN